MNLLAMRGLTASNNQPISAGGTPAVTTSPVQKTSTPTSQAPRNPEGFQASVSNPVTTDLAQMRNLASTPGILPAQTRPLVVPFNLTRPPAVSTPATASPTSSPIVPSTIGTPTGLNIPNTSTNPAPLPSSTLGSHSNPGDSRGPIASSSTKPSNSQNPREIRSESQIASGTNGDDVLSFTPTRDTFRRENRSDNFAAVNQTGNGGNDRLSTNVSSEFRTATIRQHGDSPSDTNAAFSIQRAVAIASGRPDPGVDSLRESRDGNDTLVANSQAFEQSTVEQRGWFGDDDLRANTGTGDDKIQQYGEGDNDTLSANGGAGNDTILQDGGAGNDRINYTLSSGRDQVTVNGGEGQDRATFSYGQGDNFTIVDDQGRVLERVGNGTGTTITMSEIEDYTLVNRDAPRG